MITFAQCAAFAGLFSNEMILGATPSGRHYSLLASYLLNLGRGPVAVRDMIVSDLRSFLNLGATQRAADLLIVLRIFLSEYPQARCVPCQLDREEDNAPIPLFSNLRGQNEAQIRSQVVGACVSKTGRRQEMSPGFDTKVALAEDDFDASVSDEEGGVILLSRRSVMGVKHHASTF